MRKVRVPLGDRSYNILIGDDLLSRLGSECQWLKLGKRCAIITDENVGKRYERVVGAQLERAGFEHITITLPAGETSKTMHQVEACHDQLARHRLDRHAFIVALGGGVVGDIAGFVAATYLRGISFVQVPTSLLAQVDSSVGGKVGVNLKSGKNLVGAFHQPRLVLCDLHTLKTLPPRELHAGLAEVIKYGIIKDSRFFDQVEKELDMLLRIDMTAMGAIVARCCEIKAEVVGEDEKESGLRAILNFGHTIGHAIENTVGYGQLLHGEAISIGQVAAAWLSAAIFQCPLHDVERIQQLLSNAGLPVNFKLSPARRQKLLEAMRLDKKVDEGEVKFVLCERIGSVKHGQSVPPDLVEQALNWVDLPAPTPVD